MLVTRYTVEEIDSWNRFINRSKNATFMLHRDFMEYHSDRFRDHSLVIRDKKGKIAALLPANENDKAFHSHQGLTYAGLLIDDKMTLPRMVEIFDAVVEYISDNGFNEFIYKSIPAIYHSIPAEEDRYCLFLNNAKLYRRDTLTVIDYRNILPRQERRIRSLKKARNTGLVTQETDDYEQFWEILRSNLENRYQVKPVHNIPEIKLLTGRFPENIKLFSSFKGNSMLAGAVVFASKNVCHIQYNAASEEGKKSGALDLVLDYLINYYSKSKRYFDFGISNEKAGRFLNTGLDEYKESFGGRTVTHDFYRIDID